MAALRQRPTARRCVPCKRLRASRSTACSGPIATPPAQALGWITDLYRDDRDLLGHDQTIVYATHDSIGHLGIFVGADIAKKEHDQIVTSLDVIDHLPPGLYEMQLVRKDGSVFRHDGRVLSANHPAAALTLTYAERLLKFLLWMKGGPQVLVAGAPEIAAALAKIYAPGGARAFDYDFMGTKIFGRVFSVEAVAFEALPAVAETSLPMGRHLEGCRIGFDLGGSDRKAAALIDGQVVFSEEIAWDPYFQKDPAYHIEGVHDSLRRAAAHLPRAVV